MQRIIGARTSAHALAFGVASMVLVMGVTRRAAAGYEPHKYTEPGTGLVLEYNLYVPNDYDRGRKYPLLVFLHAAGQDSDLPRDLRSSGKGWTGSFLDNGDDKKYPSFFLIPISQTNRSGWGDGRSDAEKFEGRLTIVVLKQLVASGEYNIDPDRLYLTGPSMGGRGTWDMIEKNPGLFAAAVPAAAPGLDEPEKVVGENIWSINGERDSTVGDNRKTIAAIRALGGNPIYTELAGHGHDTWRDIYPSDAFMEWVYAQRRGVPWWYVSEVPKVPHPLTPGQPAVTGPTGPADVPDGTGGAAGSGQDEGAGGMAGATQGSGGFAGHTDAGAGPVNAVGGGNSMGGGLPTNAPEGDDTGTPPKSEASCRYASRPSPGPASAAWLAALALVVTLRRRGR
ncbi:hypothetical protein WMF37_32370 [Sorangium sp. So ce291]|uniref:carboxylesterase family protein n=1 Tax=unclassified Sorangium TaxID=2621164 RepID=UPI003EFED1E4